MGRVTRNTIRSGVGMTWLSLVSELILVIFFLICRPTIKIRTKGSVHKWECLGLARSGQELSSPQDRSADVGTYSGGTPGIVSVS